MVVRIAPGGVAVYAATAAQRVPNGDHPSAMVGGQTFPVCAYLLELAVAAMVVLKEKL